MMTRWNLCGPVLLAWVLAMPFSLRAQPAELASEAVAPTDPDVAAGQAAYEAEKCDEALVAWRRASTRGVGAAYGGLGLLYLGGLGVPADEAAARRLFERAVAKNHLPSFLPLARMRFMGSAVRPTRSGGAAC